MIAFGLLVTVSVLPTLLNEALPETIDGPVGFAIANSATKHDATASGSNLRFGLPRRRKCIFFPSPDGATVQDYTTDKAIPTPGGYHPSMTSSNGKATPADRHMAATRFTAASAFLRHSGWRLRLSNTLKSSTDPLLRN